MVNSISFETLQALLLEESKLNRAIQKECVSLNDKLKSGEPPSNPLLAWGITNFGSGFRRPIANVEKLARLFDKFKGQMFLKEEYRLVSWDTPFYTRGDLSFVPKSISKAYEGEVRFSAGIIPSSINSEYMMPYGFRIRNTNQKLVLAVDYDQKAGLVSAVSVSEHQIANLRFDVTQSSLVDLESSLMVMDLCTDRDGFYLASKEEDEIGLITCVRFILGTKDVLKEINEITGNAEIHSATSIKQVYRSLEGTLQDS